MENSAEVIRHLTHALEQIQPVGKMDESNIRMT